MKLKVNSGMGFFEVETIDYIPNLSSDYVEDFGIRLLCEQDEEEIAQQEEEMYHMLREDDRFIVYQGDTFGSSEVYIKEGTEVQLVAYSRYLSEGIKIAVGGFLFYIPNLAYLDGDLSLIDEKDPYIKWENFSDEELKQRGVKIYIPFWKKMQIRRKRLIERLHDIGIYEE